MHKKNVVPNSIKQFYIQNQVKQVTRIDFENILKSNTDKDINGFKTIIDSRDIIDYKFSSVAPNDSITFSIKIVLELQFQFRLWYKKVL
jgi:hypothetical protein